MAKRPSITEIMKQLTEDERQQVHERLHGDLKIFKYRPQGSKTLHLYAEGQSGTVWSLCRQIVDDTVPASQVVNIPKGVCRVCAKEALTIFSRTRATTTDR